jgi:hypothetical protein
VEVGQARRRWISTLGRFLVAVNDDVGTAPAQRGGIRELGHEVRTSIVSSADLEDLGRCDGGRVGRLRGAHRFTVRTGTSDATGAARPASTRLATTGSMGL